MTGKVRKYLTHTIYVLEKTNFVSIMDFIKKNDITIDYSDNFAIFYRRVDNKVVNAYAIINDKGNKRFFKNVMDEVFISYPNITRKVWG